MQPEAETLYDKLLSVLEANGEVGLGKDFLLQPPNANDLQQVAHVYRRNRISPQLLQALYDQLLEFDQDWTVLLLEASLDGNLLEPLGGLSISKNGPTPYPEPKPVSAAQQQADEGLFGALRELLLEHGRESAFRDSGDFWVIDDKWIPGKQQVAIYKEGLLTREVVTKVQSLLALDFPESEVVLWRDFADASDCSYLLTGVRVSARSIDWGWKGEE